MKTSKDNSEVHFFKRKAFQKQRIGGKNCAKTQKFPLNRVLHIQTVSIHQKIKQAKHIYAIFVIVRSGKILDDDDFLK